MAVWPLVRRELERDKYELTVWVEDRKRRYSGKVREGQGGQREERAKGSQRETGDRVQKDQEGRKRGRADGGSE